MGTRFLPATKATPKEMLPVVDKPAIQYVVEEAIGAGLTDVLIVTGRNKRSVEDHFDRHDELERALEAKGDDEHLALVRAPSELGQLHYVRQGSPLGLGHAVACARQHVGSEPFAVLLGDDLVSPGCSLLSRMVDVQSRYGGSVVALHPVPLEQIHLYGCAAVTSTPEEDVLAVTDLVEKPEAEEAPSGYALIGRYVLHPAVFDVLDGLPPGRGGEIQLTDALRELARRDTAVGGGVRGVIFTGRRFDTGDRLEYLKTVVELASQREDLGPALVDWLTEFVTPAVPS
jgi:UTP--glucose-1-phosphate uridylyltransferase